MNISFYQHSKDVSQHLILSDIPKWQCHAQELFKKNKIYWEWNMSHIKFTFKFLYIIELCNHHHYLLSEHSETCILSSILPVAPAPVLGNHHMDLPIPDTSYKRNQTICGLLWLACCTWHNVFKIHPYCGMYQHCIHFYCQTNIPLYGYATFC